MTKLYSRTVALNTDIVDAFCVLQKGFTDQFVYYDKERPIRYLGLGRCIALATLGEADVVSQDAGFAPVFFSFNRFDAENPKPADDMMTAFPRLRLMLPELVLIQNEQGSFLQVNSLGPVYQGRVDRFVRHAEEAKPRTIAPWYIRCSATRLTSGNASWTWGLVALRRVRLRNSCLRAASSLRPNSRFRRRMYW